jgi:LysM repeat protein
MTAALRVSSIDRSTIDRPGIDRPERRSPLRLVPDPTIHVRVPARAARRPSAATYRRRRAVVGGCLAALFAVGVVAGHDVLAGSGGDPASAAVSQPAHAVRTVVAQPGDTLWSIASAHRGEISITRYLDTLVDINGGATIQVGQVITLP